jgi:peptide-methionine (S)-S-oxide reductase
MANHVLYSILVIGLFFPSLGFGQAPARSQPRIEGRMSDEKNAVAVFGGGCFGARRRCSTSCRGSIGRLGYTGGSVKSTYEQVCGGRRACRRPDRIRSGANFLSRADDGLLRDHDPTTLNRQGDDTGTQYRSAIFYADEKQKKPRLS